MTLEQVLALLSVHIARPQSVDKTRWKDRWEKQLRVTTHGVEKSSLIIYTVLFTTLLPYTTYSITICWRCTLRGSLRASINSIEGVVGRTNFR